MRIAFYAPLKPPTSPSPSGDRLIARLLMNALERAGNKVELVSQFRSYDREGNAVRQARLKILGERLAQRLARQFKVSLGTVPPDLWFTYHLFSKAPDWLGPTVANILGIPYVIAEASVSPKQKGGPWDLGYKAGRAAISMADLVVGTNTIDAECVVPLLSEGAHYLQLTPFIDTEPFTAARADRHTHRKALVRELGLDENETWLLTVAMMRPGHKMQSYKVLGRALATLMDTPWKLLVAGAGPTEADVRRALSGCGERVVWLGERDRNDVPALYAASDACIWPAVRETPGMCFLEAQATGIPVVGGRAGGVPSVIEDGVTGYLTEAGNVEDFAAAVLRLIHDAELRRSMGESAANRIAERHTVAAAGETLRSALKELAS